MADDRRTQIERAREEVERTVREAHETSHRAMDRKYNLLRVSERRRDHVRMRDGPTTVRGSDSGVEGKEGLMAIDYARCALPKGSTKLDRAIAGKVKRLLDAKQP